MTSLLLEGYDEPALIARAQAGCAESFGELYRLTRAELSRAVGGKLRKLTGRYDRDLIEDIVADTYVRAWRRIETFEHRGKPLVAWLQTIAGNLLVDHLKCGHGHYERPTTAVTEYTALGDWFDRPAPLEQGPEHLVETAGQVFWLSAVLTSVNPYQREALLRRHYLGQTCEEAAAAMGLQVGAYKTLVHRALKSARRQAGVVWSDRLDSRKESG